ncbi:hypothetical protein Tco_0948883 [Tanacetum coccineum]
MNTHHYGGRVSDTNARVRLQLRVGIVLVLGHRDELIHTAYMPESGGRGGGGKEEDLGGGYNTIGCHYLRNSTERDSSNRKRRELSLFSTGGGISSSSLYQSESGSSRDVELVSLRCVGVVTYCEKGHMRADLSVQNFRREIYLLGSGDISEIDEF